MTHHPWTMAYWYAVGRNDERAGYPGNPHPTCHNPDYVDPIAFANHYQGRHDDYKNPQSATFHLPCLPDCFTEWLEDTHVR